MRSLLYISGLSPTENWEHALSQAVNIQNRTALPGRCTPYQIGTGKKPNVINLRIFGCEALAFIEKDKRKKINPKVQKTIYLGMSDSDTDDTYKLLDVKTNKIIYRKNVFFNERSFPASKQKRPITKDDIPDTGDDLIGLDFEDGQVSWTITKTGFENGTIPILYYKNKDTKEEERSTRKEVRTWYNRTVLQNNANRIAPTRKGYINNLAEETYKTVMQFDVNLPHSKVPKPRVSKRRATHNTLNGSKQRTRKEKDHLNFKPGTTWNNTKSPLI